MEQIDVSNKKVLLGCEVRSILRKKYGTLDEAAKALGMSRGTVYNNTPKATAINTNVLPKFFSEDEIADLMDKYLLVDKARISIEITFEDERTLVDYPILFQRVTKMISSECQRFRRALALAEEILEKEGESE